MASTPAARAGGTRSEILALTGLRFVAAFYVFVFHVQLRWPVADGPLGTFLSNGAAGMSLFFVLSGYVLSYQYSQRKTTWRSYAVNRFARIAPVYALAALMTLPSLLVDMNREGWPLGKFVGILLTNASATQAWIPAYFDYWNNSASWSISAEVFFYAMLPLLLFLLRRVSRLWVVFIALYFLCVAPAVLFRMSGLGEDQGIPVFYAIPVFRIPEFIIGICLQRITWRGRYANGMFVVSTGLLIVALTLQQTREIYVTNNWFIVPLVCIMIASATRASGVFSRILSHDFIVSLGKASYCFYSFQFFIFLVAYRLLSYLGAIDPLITFLTCLLALSAVSLAGHRYVEEPARRWIQDRAAGRAALRSASV